MSKKGTASEVEELDFVQDNELRKTVEDAIQYIYIIFDQAKNSESELYKEETYRVIILYVISVIEAILLYVLKSRNEQITYIEYKYITSLPEGFSHSEVSKSSVVVAVPKKQIKTDSQIGLVELVDFMKDGGLMKDQFAKKILVANDIRNTFHLTKSHSRIKCEIGTVEKSLELLIKVIKSAPKAIVFTKEK
ncbi:MAG: hypothetical protein Q7J30_00625 [Candidatus Azambacteria bacterium]|nr:hypothetical protein [Candidatus Azambacteria bacterium]